jgi:uncharacterized protein (TIGR04551 family)
MTKLNHIRFDSKTRRSCLASSLVFATLLGGAGAAWAQMGAMPGGMSPGGMGAPPPPGEQHDEGPAEAEPEEEGKVAAEAGAESGYANQHRRRTQVIELDGYFRTRPELLHNFNLGLGYGDLSGNPQNGFPPFPMALECGTSTTGCSQKNLGDTNMRLRLEPTINISDQVRVVAQIDVFDNLIYGSTPDSLASAARPDLRTNLAQTGILSNSQVTPESGQNTYTSAIRPKRAWGEVDGQLGSLRFGRMPWHFGRGMYFNKGDCQDCDGGTTVDRLMALTQVYGHQLALSWDFGPSGYAWGMTDAGRADPNGSPLDLSQNDEVVQFTAALTMKDDDRRFRERAQSGELVINYGAQLVYRTQNNEVFKLSDTAKQNQTSNGTISIADLNNASDITNGAASLTQHIDAWLLIPSVWFKLGWKALTLEFEGTALAGRMGNAGPLRLQESVSSDNHLSILQLGWVLAADLKLYKDSLFIGFETGGATGDQAETACSDTTRDTITCSANTVNPSPYLNYRWKFVPQPIGDSALHNFYFSPEYHVDEIFFRRIMGTVTNAIYVKPSIAYWLDVTEGRQLGLSGSVVYSLAPVPVSTPGNSMSYGVEMDLNLGYRNIRENFYAGLVWGVFWPFGALNRPVEIFPSGAGTATAAQILRTFVGIKF